MQHPSCWWNHPALPSPLPSPLPPSCTRPTPPSRSSTARRPRTGDDRSRGGSVAAEARPPGSAWGSVRALLVEPAPRLMLCPDEPLNPSSPDCCDVRPAGAVAPPSPPPDLLQPQQRLFWQAHMLGAQNSADGGRRGGAARAGRPPPLAGAFDASWAAACSAGPVRALVSLLAQMAHESLNTWQLWAGAPKGQDSRRHTAPPTQVGGRAGAGVNLALSGRCQGGLVVAVQECGLLRRRQATGASAGPLGLSQRCAAPSTNPSTHPLPTRPQASSRRRRR